MIKLALDVDGVFADFNKQFIQEFIALTGKDLRPDPAYQPHTWNYPQALGYGEADVRAVWQGIDRDPLWWTRLEAYQHAEQTLRILETMIEQHEVSVHFLTTRPSQTAHWQTTTWLQNRMGVPPQVCVCKNAESKAMIAKGLGIDIFLDDNIDNILAMKQHAPEVIAIVYDQPWNRTPEFVAAIESLQGCGRVSSLAEFIQYVEYVRQQVREVREVRA